MARSKKSPGQDVFRQQPSRREATQSWHKEVERILLDGEWHLTTEITDVTWHLVPMHLAIRSFAGGKPMAKPRSLAQRQLTGARKWAVTRLNQLGGRAGYAHRIVAGGRAEIQKIPVYVVSSSAGYQLCSHHAERVFRTKKEAVKFIDSFKKSKKKRGSLSVRGPEIHRYYLGKGETNSTM